MKLSPAAETKLVGVHPDLIRVVRHAARDTPLPFTITCGVRTAAEQRKLVASGASQTMRSRHLTGHAVDLAALVDGKVAWDWPLYHRLAVVMKQAAAFEKVPIEWGGDWRSFPDGPHFQLPWAQYPA
jgi:peptidoglycan L-alanyl-D-glutamate endopeptidase CwlK